MFRSQVRTIILSLALCASIATPHAAAETMYGITATLPLPELVSFDSATPGASVLVGTITGVTPGQFLRAIDFRPATGGLYGIGHDASTTGQLYRIDIATAVATPVGAPFPLAFTSTRLSMDFNPVVDRIRVVTSDDHNLRLNPDTGAVSGTDTALAYAAGDANAGDNPLISDVAYTNNVVGATSTTLYGWDFLSDTFVRIGSIGGTPTSPNSGQLFTVLQQPTIVTGAANSGMDVSGETSVAYFSHANTPDVNDTLLKTIDLTTGTLTLVGSFAPTVMLDISVLIVPSQVFANGFE